MYKVTLAIPVYNVENYIEVSLLSALNQTFENIEYLIVDDKGSDSSMEIVQRIMLDHPRRKDVRIIEHSANKGIGASRNTAIDNAQGEFLYFLDGDDEITIDCIRILYEKMMETPVDFVVASHRCITRSEEILENFIISETLISGELEIARLFFEERSKSLSVVTWNKLFRLSLLRENNIRCLPIRSSEDLSFSFQLFLNATSCRLLSDVTYYYFDTPNSLTKKFRSKNLPLRFCQQYVEIITFERTYIQKYRHTKIFESALQSIIFYAMDSSLLINDSKMISNKEKKRFLKEISIFPIHFNEITSLKRKRFFLTITWIFFQMPFKIFLFRCIRIASVIKKNITFIN